MSTVKAGRYDLHYIDEGDGPAVLLIHGLAGDLTAWDSLIAVLRRTYRVVALDNRGAGLSTQVDEPVNTMDLAHDALAVLDAIGIQQAHVVGRSMGGAIAQHLALLWPERVRSIALCGSFAKLDPVGRRVLTNMREVLELSGDWEAHARHSIVHFLSPMFINTAEPELLAHVMHVIGDSRRLPACYIAQNQACLEHDTLTQLGQIQCPVVVMSGDLDAICSPLCTQWLLEGLPQARHERFEGSSHFFMMEQPARFIAGVESWLRGCDQ